MTNTITCRELIEFLDDYVADRLAPPTRSTFEQHLGICRHCRDYLASYRQTIALAQDAMSEPTGKTVQSIPEDIVRAVLASRPKS